MVGHQPEEFNVTHGKQTSSALRWTIGFFILIIWGALAAYIGYLSAQTIFTKAVIDDLGEVDVAVGDMNDNEEEKALKTFDGNYVSFDYVEGWHVASLEGDFAAVIRPGLISSVTAASSSVSYPYEPSHPIEIFVYDNDATDYHGEATDLLEETVQSYVTDDSEIEKISLNGVEITSIRNYGDQEFIVFVGNEFSVRVAVTGPRSSARDQLRDSLDFSKMK